MQIGLCATAYLFDGLVSVMEADATSDARQEALLYKVVPTALMRASGFLDASGSRTGPLYEQALAEGRVRLADELPEGEGAGLCRHFWRMAAIDGRVTLAEIATIAAYAAVVGIDEELNDEIGLDVLQEMSRGGLEIEVPATWSPGSAAEGVDIQVAVELPEFGSIHAFSCSAADALSAADGWERVQRGMAAALGVLAGTDQNDVCAFCCTDVALSPLNRTEERLFILFARTGPPPSADTLISVREHLKAAGVNAWDEGSQSLPDKAFPTLCVVGGQLCHLWLPDETGPVLLSIRWDDDEASAMVTGIEPGDATDEEFLPEATHALLA